MYDRLVYVPTTPKSVVDYLMPGEEVVVAVRMHPLVIVQPVAFVFAGLIVAVALTTGGIGSSGIHTLLWLLFAALVAWAAWKIIDWRLTYFVITENRIMLVTGVFSRSIAMLPLAKVTDMRLERTPAGRAFGYGQFVVESAGQDQALRNVPFVPYPRLLYQEILAMIFPRKAPAGPPGPPPPPGPPGPPGPEGPPGPPRPTWPSARPGDDPGF